MSQQTHSIKIIRYRKTEKSPYPIKDRAVLLIFDYDSKIIKKSSLALLLILGITPYPHLVTFGRFPFGFSPF